MESDRLIEGACFLMAAVSIAYMGGREGWRTAFLTPVTYAMLVIASISLPHAVGVVPRWFQVAMWWSASASIIAAFAVAIVFRNTHRRAP